MKNIEVRREKKKMNIKREKMSSGQTYPIPKFIYSLK